MKYARIICRIDFLLLILYLFNFHLPLAMSDRQDNQHGFWWRAFHLYYDGFRSMTVGKTLWLIIGIKIFIFFVIIKLLFFPDFLNTKCDSEQEKAEYVRHQLAGF